MEDALTTIIIATLTENIERKKRRERERNGLNLGLGYYCMFLG